MVRYYNRPMKAQRPLRPEHRHRAARALAAAGALALAALATHGYFAEQRRIVELRGEAVAAGFAEDETLLRDISRESDADRASLRLARAIVARDLAPEPDVPRGSRLEQARALGREALAAHPAAWQAPMILGAATYLEWSIARDGRLYRQAEAWQDPLQRSLELSSGRSEPAQFLASAYLELWPALSPERRRQARHLVRRAMESPEHFGRLLEPWLSRAEDRQDAFELIPQDPQAWRQVTRHYADRGQWKAYAEASGHGFEAEKALARRFFDDASERLAGRDLRAARHLFFSSAMVAPAGREMDPLVDEALARAPAGPYNPHYTAGLNRHLERATTLFLHRTVPFRPETVARLSVASGDLPPPQAALAALAADNLPEAELIARRAEAERWTPEWSPYRVARARTLLGRGDLPGAAASLHEAEASWRGEPIYWWVQRELARRAGNRAEELRADERLQDLTAGRREPGDWQRIGERRYRLTFWGGSSAEAIELALDTQPAAGGAVAATLDGEPAGRWSLPARRPLRLDAVAAPEEVHILEIESLAGGPVVPGRIRTLPAGG